MPREATGNGQARDPRYRCLAPSFLPTAAVLELTYRCNHECRFCSCPWFSPRGDYPVHPEMSVSDWKQAIDALCARGVSDLAFTGGEPLLKEGLAEILAYAAGRRCRHVRTAGARLVEEVAPPRLMLLSNGRSMTEAVLELCRVYDVRLSLSLPGLASLAEHTGGGNAERVLHWFGRAHLQGVRSTAGVTVTRRNLVELYETIATALLAGADSLLLNRFLPGGRGLAFAAELQLDAAGVVEMLDTAEDVLKTANRYGSVGTELPQCLIPAGKYAHLEVGSRCAAARAFFAVDPSGFVRVCNHSPVRLRHISVMDELQADTYWRQFAMRDYSPAACTGCGVRHLCDGGCREAAHIVGGQVDAADPLIRRAGITGGRQDPLSGRARARGTE